MCLLLFLVHLPNMRIGIMQTAERLTELRRILAEVCNIRNAMSLLHWDQETYMPVKAAPGRGEQLATLASIEHRTFTDPKVGSLLAELGESELSPDDVKLVEVMQYDYDRATKLPEAFVSTFTKETSEALEVWSQARKESNFSIFQPKLERLLDLLKEKAELYGYEESPYDALLEEFEPGMTAGQLRPIFSDLAERQSALVERIVASGNQPDAAWTRAEWDEEAQWKFTLNVLRDIGYDFDAGRQDKSVHPFTTDFGLYDVRVTTRVDPHDLFSALTGSIHEGGHALYEQGQNPGDQRTPLAQGTSLGMHESQSRMWENVIGRSQPFWRHYAPIMRDRFPGRLQNVTAEQMYAAINRVEPSFIRVEADECTYNLHIIIRFEIEVDLMEGRLAVADVPEAWNAKVQSYLGLDVEDDANGCLQDIHWSHGAIGYFPTYALGNLYAAQLFETIEESIPDIWTSVESGQFTPLLEWLRENVHRHGRRKKALEILRDATGKEPSSEPFMRYLEKKYGALYGLSD